VQLLGHHLGIEVEQVRQIPSGTLGIVVVRVVCVTALMTHVSRLVSSYLR
jgi:hypothetical protein